MLSRLERLAEAGRAHVASFFGWWGGEIASLMPARLTQRLTGDNKRVLLGVAPGGFRVRVEGARRDGGDVTNDVVAPAPQAIAAAVALAARDRLAGVTLLLPRSSSFVRTVELPRAALKECRRVLDLDLERATPFRRADVYTSYTVLDTHSGSGKAAVLQYVAKREAVDPLVAEIVKAGGRVAAIDVASGPDDHPAGINFIADADGGSGAGRGRSAAGLLALAAVLLLMLACGQVYFKHEAALAELREQTALLRKEASAVRQSREQSEVAIKDLAALQSIKLRQVPLVVVLEEITRILPDTAWVTDVRIESDIVDISGLAKSGATLLPLFERSAIFGEAALTAPLTFDQREDKERFSLRVRIKSTEVRSTGAAG